MVHKILFNNFNKLGDVIRYAGLRQARSESLSDHIINLQLIGSLIINHLNDKFNEDIDYGKFLIKSLHHDLDEVITSDIPRPIKYYNKEIRDSIKSATIDLSKKFYGYYFPKYYYYWEHSKSDDKEGFLVHYCDLISVVIKSLEEVKTFNNLSFLRVISESDSTVEYLKEELTTNEYNFNEDSVKFLKSVVDESLFQMRSTKKSINNSEIYDILGLDFYKKGDFDK